MACHFLNQVPKIQHFRGSDQEMGLFKTVLKRKGDVGLKNRVDFFCIKCKAGNFGFFDGLNRNL